MLLDGVDTDTFGDVVHSEAPGHVIDTGFGHAIVREGGILKGGVTVGRRTHGVGGADAGHVDDASLGLDQVGEGQLREFDHPEMGSIRERRELTIGGLGPW